MRTKALIIIVGIFVIQFIASCCRDVRYYDFTQMSAELSSTEIKKEDSLTIKLIALDLEFIASNISELGFSSSLAFSCDDGWGGMKYPFNKIEITSDSDFSSELLANDNLVNQFQVQKFIGNGAFEFVPFSTLKTEDLATLNLQFLLINKPTIAMKHKFKIKMVKSNDEEVIVESEEVTWQ